MRPQPLRNKREHAGDKDVRQDVGDKFRGNPEIFNRPFMEDADGAADGAGDRIRKFVPALSGRRMVLHDLRYIAVEHGQDLPKEGIASLTPEQTG